MTTGPDLLRAYRSEHGITTEALAAALGVSEDTIYAWLAGRKTPGLPAALRLEQVAGIPVEAWAAAPARDDNVCR
jgi:transcriptional regulator with XRE-family HTH domain